jgi:hypothetical protein
LSINCKQLQNKNSSNGKGCRSITEGKPRGQRSALGRVTGSLYSFREFNKDNICKCRKCDEEDGDLLM